MLVEDDGSWRFYLRVLKRTGSGILICLEHQAMNGGTYHTQGVLSLTRKDARSRLTGRYRDGPGIAACPVFEL